MKCNEWRWSLMGEIKMGCPVTVTSLAIIICTISFALVKVTSRHRA